MPITQVQICNMALTHIGIKQLISSITDDNEEANMCDLYWDTALQNALNEGDWAFARQRVDLVEAAGVDTVKELRNRKPANLLAKMVEINKAKRLVRRLPTESMVERWVAHAAELPPVVKY